MMDTSCSGDLPPKTKPIFVVDMQIVLKGVNIELLTKYE
jgi:hypothetical protein